ncbi:hypothetical protein D3C75_1162390 [compost metagenome]
MGQALGDEVGDHQHVGPGKIRLLQLYQRLLEAGHQIGAAVETHGEEAFRLVQTGVCGDLERRHLGGK